jgi:predicted HicB family RNase H-like nuclease
VKKVNIGLKEKVHTQAKVISVLKGVSLNSFIEQAIEKAIEKDINMIKDLGK